MNVIRRERAVDNLKFGFVMCQNIPEICSRVIVNTREEIYQIFVLKRALIT